MSINRFSWRFWIDVGGTFTDCIGVSPDGQMVPFKTLSSGLVKGRGQTDATGRLLVDRDRRVDPEGFWTGSQLRILNGDGGVVSETAVNGFDAATGSLRLGDAARGGVDIRYELDCLLPAPVLTIRWLLKLLPGEPCPPVNVRFGTTRGTNALLTRTGARTALVTTRGFADVPLIGNQTRPDLFDLNICKPQPLFAAVFEVDERIDSEGAVLRPLDARAARERLEAAGICDGGFDSVAVCLMNAYRNPVHEQQLEALVRAMGFDEVSRSSEVSPLVRFVPRCDTTTLDAYLNPVLRTYLQLIRQHLPGSRIQVMTSACGLVDSGRFRGRDCILSGPAGGIVGFSRIAQAAGFEQSIGFDMGGTSTDVARFDGRFEFENETTKAGVRIMTPVLAIETVAAGGGSICSFDGVRLFVGPDSAGANPGPACYGAGGPLTVTDLNVFLGRLPAQHFPFPLTVDAVAARLDELLTSMKRAGTTSAMTREELAEGLLRIANDNMARAIRRVSVAKGYHPADHVLVTFGGAGGQHACSVARQLSMPRVLIHPFAGILSAYGMGQAGVRSIRQRSVLRALSPQLLADLQAEFFELEIQGHAEVADQAIPQECIAAAKRRFEVRYAGTDATLTVPAGKDATARDIIRAFETEHQRLYGYVRSERKLEVAAMEVEVIGSAATDGDTDRVPAPHQAPATAAAAGSVRHQQDGSGDTMIAWFDGRAVETKVLTGDNLQPGTVISGPAIICEATSTIVVEPGCSAEVMVSGAVLIHVDASRAGEAGKHDPQRSPDVVREGAVSAAANPQATGSDPVLLEVFNNQFTSMAEQMGEMLRRTAVSTNVRERLDYSCALFDGAGQLVVNAPHVPVHLGAMSETVRAIMTDHPHMLPGDVYVTNDPYRGGSHLPDVTVVTPVFVNGGEPRFFVANRAHHAEIGGVVPGSMPPFSRHLGEEGVLIRSQKLVDAGQSREDAIRRLLTSGLHPSRAADDNLADLAAQVAANACGTRLLQQLCQQQTVETVLGFMQHIQGAASKKMRLALSRLQDRTYAYSDSLDDGTPVAVAITVCGDEATVDFSGTAGVHPGNLNANRAITTAAVLYSFRCLLNEEVPLNAGVLDPLTLVIPEGLLNPRAGDSPADSPAMVGGNVETSQRIVDVLLGALGLAAASQGTMNNLTFGDATLGYYETICGGAGATSSAAGADAVHTHMTNTRLTDPEILEQRYPVRLRQFSIRQHSGGKGQHCGGNGIVRKIEFLKSLKVSMLSQRRGENRPYGLQGGCPGMSGVNSLCRLGTEPSEDLGSSFSIDVRPGDVLSIETPGGGGCGAADG